MPCSQPSAMQDDAGNTVLHHYMQTATPRSDSMTSSYIESWLEFGADVRCVWRQLHVSVCHVLVKP